MSTDKFYTPFVRHYKDWHRYKIQGNIFLKTTIRLRNLNILKIQLSIETLVLKREILRSAFKFNTNNQLQHIIKAYNPALFIPIYIEASTENDILTSDTKSVNIEEGGLIKFYIIKRKPEHYELLLYVHHMICNGSSLQIIKQDFISIYKNESRLQPYYKFQDYSNYKNEKLFKELPRTLNFYRTYLGKNISVGNYIPAKKDEFLKYLSEQEYYVIQDSKTSVPLQYHVSHNLGITLSSTNKFLIKNQITWSSLILSAYSLTMSKKFGEHKLLGLLFDDRHNKISKEIIGELTGESFFKIKEVQKLTIEEVQKVNMILFKLGRNLIFNYNMYSLNEESIYKECIGFFNFTISPEEAPYIDSAATFKDISSVGLPIEPIMTLFENGVLVINWRFDETYISKIDLIKLEKCFIENILIIIDKIKS